MVKQVKQLKVVKQLNQLNHPKRAKNGYFSDLKVSCSTLIALPTHSNLIVSTGNEGIKNAQKQETEGVE